MAARLVYEIGSPRLKRSTSFSDGGWLTRVLVLALAAAVVPVCAEAGGRSLSPSAQGDSDGFKGAPRTVESVSREAQREIRACSDSEAFQCVAAVLTRYAAALNEIARERRNPSSPTP